MLSLKFFIYSKQHSVHSENRDERVHESSGRFQEVKNNGKSLIVRPKKWSRSLTGGGRLLEVPIVRL